MPADSSLTEHSHPGPPIRLAASLDIGTAQALLGQLRGALADGAVVLDARDVERVSVPCLQILAAASRAGADGGALRIVAASPALMAAVADLGLAAAIPLEG